MTALRTVYAEDYQWKTQPYDHQRDVFLRSRDVTAYALLMEMGTGKTKVTIDTAAWLYGQGQIRGMLVIAPNGVHRNWIDRELPVHMPDWADCRSATWASTMRKAEEKQVDALFDLNFKGLRVLAMNVEAFRDSQKCNAARLARRFLEAYPTLMVIDEASKIKTPGAKRTKAMLTLGRQAKYRRILTGTPVTNSPLDIYAPFSFLDRTILGYDNFYSFKHHFAEWEQEKNFRTGQRYETLKGYRNMDELRALTASSSYRITKDECLDLPDKIYQVRYVGLTTEQRKIYNDIAERSLIELDDGEELSVANVLTKLIRLQQVLGGFVPREEFAPAEPIPGTNPRLEVLKDITEETDGKMIIWARFRTELAAIAEMLRKEYGRRSVVEYHGGVDRDLREENVTRFQTGDARFFVGQQHSGGYGITLHAATTVVYFSNDFSLEARLQSEDRAHRIGQKHPVNYVDIECVGTIDTKIIEALRTKRNLADMITQDNARLLLAKAASTV